MATLAELTTPRTPAEIEAAIYAGLEAKGGKPASTWKPGAVTKALIIGVAILIAAFDRLIAAITGGGFLELATGDWLTVYARHVYGVERDPGAYASGNLTLSNAGGGVFSGEPGDLIAAATAATYRNTEAFSIGSMESGVVVPFEAVEIGSAGDAAASTITTLVTTLLGVSVTNPLAFRGVDPESDAQLRERCRAKTGSLSPNGPRDAYHFAALSARREDGASVGITRIRTIADGNGGVRVIVANPGGPVTAPDLAQVDAALVAGAVPEAVTMTLESAVANVIAPTYELWVRADHALTNDELEAAIEAALGEHLSRMAIGGARKSTSDPIGRVYVDALEAVIANAAGGVLDVEVTVPSADVDLAEDEAPALGTVTPTINRVE